MKCSRQTGEDLLARAFLHETDHLYGKLYITHISALKRDLMKRKIKKLQRRRGLGARRQYAPGVPGHSRIRRSHAGGHCRSRSRCGGGAHAAGPAARPRAERGRLSREGSGASPGPDGLSAGTRAPARSGGVSARHRLRRDGGGGLRADHSAGGDRPGAARHH